MNAQNSRLIFCYWLSLLCLFLSGANPIAIWPAQTRALHRVVFTLWTTPKHGWCGHHIEIFCAFPEIWSSSPEFFSGNTAVLNQKGKRWDNAFMYDLQTLSLVHCLWSLREDLGVIISSENPLVSIYIFLISMRCLCHLFLQCNFDMEGPHSR